MIYHDLRKTHKCRVGGVIYEKVECLAGSIPVFLTDAFRIDFYGAFL